MLYKIFIATFVFLCFIGCNNEKKESQKNEPPKALEDKSSSFEIVSKRGYDDLVESLYTELLSKDSDLKKLEDKIDALNESKKDSTEKFDKFNGKNQSYFSSVNKHIETISDSLLRNKMKILIDNNVANYNSTVFKHNELLKTIESRNLTINDLHTLLKIVKTLPLIETYQKNNLPNTKSLKGYIEKQNEAIEYADSLSKK